MTPSRAQVSGVWSASSDWGFKGYCIRSFPTAQGTLDIHLAAGEAGSSPAFFGGNEALHPQKKGWMAVPERSG
jgi:hypothetical protein